PVHAGRGPLHLDISTYASLIEGVPAGGSVCRGAPGRVVNIAGGGGVAPLYPEDVLREALDAAQLKPGRGPWRGGARCPRGSSPRGNGASDRCTGSRAPCS